MLTTTLAAPVLAQDDEELAGLENIVVTITKRDESIQEVAGAIAAFNDEMIANANIETVGDLIGLLPNVQVKGDTADLSIRGISRSAFDAQSPTAQHVNGVYKFRSESYLGQFYDLESVQVALGPSGTVYGRNATAGAMDIRWKQPHDQYEVFGDASFAAPYDRWQFRGGVNIPLLGPGDDTLMLRLVGIREVRDGTVTNLIGTERNSVGARDDTSFRGTLLWNVNEDLSVELRGKYVDIEKAWAGGPLVDRSTVPAGALPLGPGLSLPVRLGERVRGTQAGALYAGLLMVPLPAGNTFCEFVLLNGVAGFGLPPLVRDPAFFNPALPIPQGDQEHNTRIQALGDGFVEVSGYDVTVDYAMHGLPLLGDVALTFVGGYERVENEGLSDSDGTELAALDTESSQLPDEWYTAELRLDSQNDGWFNWTLGVFYLHQDVFQARNTLTPLTISGAIVKQSEEGFALFGNVRVNPIESVELTAGLRWNHDAVDRLEIANPTPFDLDGSIFQGSEVYRETTIDLGAKWFINDDHMVYAKWARGYKAGTIQLLPDPILGTGVVNQVKPERILATEVGWRGTWMEGRLTTNVTAFHYDYTDQQVPIILVTQIPILSADEVSIWGVEFEMRANLTEDWFTRLAVGYLNAEYDKFCSVDPLSSAATNAVFDPACAFTQASQFPRPRDLSGKTPEDSPEWKFSLLTSYTYDLGEYGRLTPTLEFTWTDESFRRPFNTAIDVVDSYTKTDLRVRWDSADDRYFVEFFGENLEDEIVYPRVIVVALTGTAQNFGLLQPRTYGIRIGFNWTGGQ